MNKITQILLITLLASMLTGCDFIKNSFTFKDKTKEFVEAILKEDYDNAVNQLAMEHEIAKETDIEDLKRTLAAFHEALVKNFGKDLSYKFMNSEKKWSTEQGEKTPPNTTLAMIEFSNDKEFGVLRVLFDDKSGKILNINILDVKQPIPNMTIFWLFGLLAISIPIFNIYVIRKVIKSNLKRKWLKYLAIVFFNVPAIGYAAAAGFSFKLLNFQIMLGISFSYMGYLNSSWIFGVPLGGLYWLWKLKRNKDEEIENEITTYPDTVIPEEKT